MSREPEDWAAVASSLQAGERAAILKVSRLIASLLDQWRAYDLRDEWPDLIQDVLMAVLASLEQGRVRRPEALVGYVAAVTRNKLTDRLRRVSSRGELDPSRSASDVDLAAVEPDLERMVEVRLLLSKLPDKQRMVIDGIYGQGWTYEEAARQTGIPLGTVKRTLRLALEALRAELGPGNDPNRIAGATPRHEPKVAPRRSR